jgi:hypothetical protein
MSKRNRSRWPDRLINISAATHRRTDLRRRYSYSYTGVREN